MTSEFVSAVAQIIPVYPFEAVQEARPPYAAYTISETPIRTKDGIAGYEGTITLAIFSTSLTAVDELMAKIIEAVDGRTLDGRRLYAGDVEVSNYPDIGLTSKDLIIQTIR